MCVGPMVVSIIWDKAPNSHISAATNNLDFLNSILPLPGCLFSEIFCLKFGLLVISETPTQVCLDFFFLVRKSGNS